ncbi:MAG: hypothetical protein EOM90_12225 [Alphaproteobacteria bacterium]|nr:hypothetical protein [Alphaproteobacteria bacterium]
MEISENRKLRKKPTAELFTPVPDYITTILRGVGQVMFQNNALTGILFLAGIFYNSWLMGLGAIAGNIASTITAKVLKYSDEDIKNGLYGFNGTLVGIITLTAPFVIATWTTLLVQSRLKEKDR